MATPYSEKPVDHTLWSRNQAKQPIELLTTLMGKYVAWTKDATEVAAVADSWEELFRKVDEMGLDPELTLHSHIPDDL